MNTTLNKSGLYDVAIIGGALSGAATAVILLREKPELRILIVEKSAAFTRRVGEATVEISTYFLTRSLGLMRYLNETQLNKQGLRFWFANEESNTLADCSEIGGGYHARVPAFLVDRATLDEEVLRRACELGATLWRTAQVQKVELVPGGNQKITVKYQDQIEHLEARWVVDASGVAAFLARQEGWWRPNSAHPTTAVWSRWKGVKDWDGIDLAKRFPCWSKACFGTRGTATNHLMGDGWWAWMIALKGGDVSIGVVFDQRLVTWPDGGSLGERLKTFLLKHPVGKELLSDAQWTEGDVLWRKNLPYFSTTYAGDGFSLVGDAAGFIDPFYSPGMDWIAFTSTCTANLILAQQKGEPIQMKVEMHNRIFQQSYDRWFKAIYQDKYEYMGDYELLRLAFLMDLGCYYIGVAAQPFLRGQVGLTEPIFTTKPSIPFYYYIRTYNRRFAAIARDRRKRNCFGRKNHMKRFMFKGYTFAPASGIPIFKAIMGWLLLEMKEGWRTWFKPSMRTEDISQPLPAAEPTTTRQIPVSPRTTS